MWVNQIEDESQPRLCQINWSWDSEPQRDPLWRQGVCQARERYGPEDFPARTSAAIRRQEWWSLKNLERKNYWEEGSLVLLFQAKRRIDQFEEPDWKN